MKKEIKYVEIPAPTGETKKKVPAVRPEFVQEGYDYEFQNCVPIQRVVQSFARSWNTGYVAE